MPIPNMTAGMLRRPRLLMCTAFAAKSSAPTSDLKWCSAALEHARTLQQPHLPQACTATLHVLLVLMQRMLDASIDAITSRSKGISTIALNP
jgi:hypothetical protein